MKSETRAQVAALPAILTPDLERKIRGVEIIEIELLRTGLTERELARRAALDPGALALAMRRRLPEADLGVINTALAALGRSAV